MILVVEDNEQMRHFICEALTDAGYAFKSAGNGKEALTLINDNNFSCILLDILLPEVDGLEVIRKLAQRTDTQKIKIIAITGGGADLPGWYAGQMAQSFGAHSVLYKPFSVDDLQDAVKLWAACDN
ncbi:MAG: response regulator [Alphaproteobacteria bacterium]|nr:response regulator [Alphaproteobacteria bacterium]MBV8549649.1 response regulator [Alphaproteobacteria bacterium]